MGGLSHIKKASSLHSGKYGMLFVLPQCSSVAFLPSFWNKSRKVRHNGKKPTVYDATHHKKKSKYRTQLFCKDVIVTVSCLTLHLWSQWFDFFFWFNVGPHWYDFCINDELFYVINEQYTSMFNQLFKYLQSQIISCISHNKDPMTEIMIMRWHLILKMVMHMNTYNYPTYIISSLIALCQLQFVIP